MKISKIKKHQLEAEEVTPDKMSKIEIFSIDDLGETIRIQLSVNGVRFKRLQHKSGLYHVVWEDIDWHFGSINTSLELSFELESIFKAWYLENVEQSWQSK